MAPMFGEPNYKFPEREKDGFFIESDDEPSYAQMAFWYIVTLVAMLLIWLFVFACLRILSIRQKTRSQPQRRTYGQRGRTSLPQQEPTIFVSPGNYPPPPKYEHMAPPSYEEVVGIHYPNYPPSQFPITRPLAIALAQNNEANSTASPEPVHVTGRTSNANEQTNNDSTNVTNNTTVATS